MIIALCLATACDSSGSTPSEATTPSSVATTPVTPAQDKVIIGPDGRAIAPRNAPETVATMIAAANRIVGLEYRLGGGHLPYDEVPIDTGYDGSGATSYVLHAAGLLSEPLTAAQFRRYGNEVPVESASTDDETTSGWWVKILVCANGVHIKIRNVEFDAHSDGFPGDGTSGPHWRAAHDQHTGCIARSPIGH